MLKALIRLIVSFVQLKKLLRNKFFDKIILRKSEKGYVVTIKDYSMLLNKEGLVKSYLRPTGRIEIEGEVYDVIADGDFVEKGLRVKVIKVEGRKIVVNKIN
ncbi:MAG: hypothetical protein COA82_12940 [Alkaliphilus sp.]|nr:MAG: hypothetical protein COA82_12940 [Alkaliphilus sp.]